MIKDLIVHLSTAEDAGGEISYAVSLGEIFDAHMTGVAFAYEPVMVGSVISLGSDIIGSQRRENENAAKAASARFSEAARAAGIRADTHLVSAGLADCIHQFGKMARGFDLSVLR